MKVWPQIISICQIFSTHITNVVSPRHRHFPQCLTTSHSSSGPPCSRKHSRDQEIRNCSRPGRNFDLAPRSVADVLNKRADDEWVVVMYDNGSGDQCGGISNQDVTGKKEGLCKRLGSLVGKICTDVKVGINIGVAKCDFSFRTDSSV